MRLGVLLEGFGKKTAPAIMQSAYHNYNVNAFVNEFIDAFRRESEFLGPFSTSRGGEQWGERSIMLFEAIKLGFMIVCLLLPNCPANLCRHYFGKENTLALARGDEDAY